LGRGAVRERDALRRGADIELEVVVDVVARLEIGGDRGLVVGLGDAAENVIIHDRAAEREIPRTDHGRRRRRLGLDRHIRRESRTRNHCQRRCCQDHFFHDDPHHFPKKPADCRMPPGTVWSLTICNLERAELAEKPKCQACADFLGVCGIPRKVVGLCCIPTTNFPVCDTPYARQRANAGACERPDTNQSCLPSLRAVGFHRTNEKGRGSLKPRPVSITGSGSANCCSRRRPTRSNVPRRGPGSASPNWARALVRARAPVQEPERAWERPPSSARTSWEPPSWLPSSQPSWLTSSVPPSWPSWPALPTS